MRLRKKVAIVTGGGSGLGAATSILFAKEGAKVLVADIRSTAAEKTAKKISVTGGSAYPFKADVTKADGYRVALVSRSKDKLEAVAGEIRNDIIADSRLDPIVCPADVADERQVKNLVLDVADKCNRIDILFNNAGRGTIGTLELDMAEFDNLLSVNLKGPFSFLKHVVPVMKRQKSGYIINLASRNTKQCETLEQLKGERL